LDNSVEIVRLAHFSDIHLTAPRLCWRIKDLFSKRVTGWMNLHLRGRAELFRRADEIVAVLMRELRELRPDRVIFSGDATTLGFDSEHAHAARGLGLADADSLPGLAVPGNHDYYVADSVRQGSFERHFAPWLSGERVEDHTYPFAQRVGPLWLVAVNSSKPNWFPSDASGQTGADQLDRLGRLLQRLAPGPRILVTHYPICVASGQPEKPSHALRDLDNLIAVATRGGIGLWLHGHRHHPYFLREPAHAPFPVVCAGSATQMGAWSYVQFTIEGRGITAVRRAYDPERHAFQTAETYVLELGDVR
jgi:3',5'-cyclic AMP phosphodiesterase CpdA